MAQRVFVEAFLKLLVFLLQLHEVHNPLALFLVDLISEVEFFGLQGKLLFL